MTLMPTETNKILIVDDQAQNLKVLTGFLHDLGASIFVAQNGEMALQIAATSHPDLILLDVMMPGIDGFETCRRLKKQEATRDVPVIFMTALTELSDKITGFSVGGVDYIIKPLQLEEVLARVKAHLLIRQQQKELEQKNNQLRTLNASKDRFFSIIAHDMRSPFSSLIMVSDLLLESVDRSNNDQVTLFENLKMVVHRLHRLLENLLDWARMQQGLMKYQPDTLNLHKIVMENIELFSENCRHKQISLIPEVAADSRVYADKEMITMVIRNLLSNAIKFTNPGGEIRVLTRTKNAFVEVVVQDNGVGISDEGKGSLFRIDKKYSTIGTAKEYGTGLGLILGKELVEKNRGTIWVDSELGKGSTFCFTVPREKPAESFL